MRGDVSDVFLAVTSRSCKGLVGHWSVVQWSLVMHYESCGLWVMGHRA